MTDWTSLAKGARSGCTKLDVWKMSRTEPKSEPMKPTLTLLTALLLAPLAALHAADAPKQRPNIVFFLIDDLGWRDLGCQGSTFYRTPNIDRLAAEGVRFTDAYAACAVCSPTRASLLTGKVSRAPPFHAHHGRGTTVAQPQAEDRRLDSKPAAGGSDFRRGAQGSRLRHRSFRQMARRRPRLRAGQTGLRCHHGCHAREEPPGQERDAAHRCRHRVHAVAREGTVPRLPLSPHRPRALRSRRSVDGRLSRRKRQPPARTIPRWRR